MRYMPGGGFMHNQHKTTTEENNPGHNLQQQEKA